MTRRPRQAQSSGEAPGRGETFLGRVAVALILLLVPLAHLPLLRAGYVQDDHLAVEFNPIVQRGDLAEILSTSYWAGASGADRSLYRPVTIFSFALERRLTGAANARVAHMINVALHLAVALSLFALLRRLQPPTLVAAASALLFAVHPVHVEAVGGIVGRAELLAAGCGFTALLALTYAGTWEAAGRLVQPGPVVRRLAAWGAGGLLFLSLGAKEVGAATLGLAVVVEAWFRPRAADGRSRRVLDRVGALAPSIVAVVVYAVLRVRALEGLVSLQTPHPLDNPLVELHGAPRLATALSLLPRYVALLFYPLGLSADYSGPAIPIQTRLLAPLPLVGSALLLLLALLALLPLLRPARRSRTRLVAFAALAFLLPYLVVGNLLFEIGTIFAERLLYLPSAGFCMLLGLLIGAVAAGGPASVRSASAPTRRPALQARIAGLTLSALLTGFATLSWARCLDWRDDATLFSAAVRVRPTAPRAHLIVGRARADRGDLAAALLHFDRALALEPTFVPAWMERGVVLGRLGRLDEALEAFHQTLHYGPAHAKAHLNLGLTLRRLGRVGQAERALRKALLWDPQLVTAWAELGNLHLDQRRFRWAAAAYRRAIALGREDLRSRLREAERGLDSQEQEDRG